MSSALLRILPLPALLLFGGCRFNTYPVTYHFPAGVTYKLRYQAELSGKAEKLKDAHAYSASTRALLSFKATSDSAKGQIEFALGVDSIESGSAERSPGEQAYMAERLRKYRARLSISRTGQVLALEEEPDLPPLGFSTLHIGRALAYALPVFPQNGVGQGETWENTHFLLDKFHPQSRVQRKYWVTSIGQNPAGRMMVCHVELQVFLDEDLGPGRDTTLPALTGKGDVIFNLEQGRPVSAIFELSGRFQVPRPAVPGGTGPTQQVSVGLRERFHLSFSG